MQKQQFVIMQITPQKHMQTIVLTPVWPKKIWVADHTIQQTSMAMAKESLAG